MALGISFGKKKNITDQTTVSDQTQTQNQTGTTSQNQTQNTVSNTTGTTTNTGTSAAESVTAGTTKQNTTGTQQQTQRSSLFSDNVLAALEAAGLGAIGSATGGAVDTSALDGFDPTAFIEGQTMAAQAAGRRSEQAAQGGLYDAIGGTAGGNTMAALLAQELNQQTAAGVAGARATAVGQANDIVRQNLQTKMAGRGQEMSLMDSILAQLKGGASESTVAGTTTESTTGETRNIGSQVGSESQTGTSTQQSTQMTELASLINQLISGTTRTQGTENVHGVNTQKGGGISLGI